MSKQATIEGLVHLTPTETKVLELISEGLSSQEAAEKLEISKRTVDFHLANIYDKLQVKNRIQAFRVAISLKLIPPPVLFS